MSSDPTWGVVSTIKAPAKDILNFAAHYLDLGAHRVCVYLDAPNPEAFKALKAHPKCRVITTDEGYWKRRRKRPAMHQPRQTMNATHCYRRNPGVDWLGHVDVDEFLWSERPLAAQLAALPETVRSARIRPVEALAADPTDPPPPGMIWCKGFSVERPKRERETARIYPSYGEHLNGGFLSHVVGKVFVRTGLDLQQFRIHNAYFDGQRDPDPATLDDTMLVHLHAKDWTHWQSLYRFRLEQGSYRESLKGSSGSSGLGLTMHGLFSWLETEGGETALRAFHDEVCVASPTLRSRLAQYGHLHSVRLDLDAKRTRHFPDAA